MVVAASIVVLLAATASGDGAARACGGPTGWKRFVCDSRELGRRFSLQDPHDFRVALGISSATAALYFGREEIRELVQDNASSSRTDAYDTGRLLSRGAVSPVLAGIFALAGKASGNSRYGETAQILLESTLYSVSFAGAGQLVLATERPEDGAGIRFFRTGGHGVSADVAIAASIVAPLDRRHLRWREGDGTAMRAFKVVGRGALYGALALSAAQRLDADDHWAPDVFLGAAGGLSIGYALCGAHEPPPRRRGPTVTAGPDRLLVTWVH